MRLRGWTDILDAEITASRARPWAWGTHDCMMFPARIVRAITGIDHAHSFSYSTEDEANAIIARHGSLEALISSLMGKPVAPAQGGRGDVVLVESEGIHAGGICIGNMCAIASPKGGLGYLKRERILKAWRV